MKRIESILSKKKTYYNIDGTKSETTKRVGFCNNNLHRGYLTKKLMDEHQCIEKGCHYFIKYEKNAYWQQKNASKEKRQKAKEEKKYWEKKENQALYLMRDLTKDIDDFGITAVYKREDYLEIRYVSLNMVNLTSELSVVKMKTGVNCKLSSVKTTYSKKVELLNLFNPSVKGYLQDIPIDEKAECIVEVIEENKPPECFEVEIEDSDIDFDIEDYLEINPENENI